MEYPIRINKYLALQKISSRKEADVLIEQGQVFINGQPAVLGDKVNEGDKVEVKGTQKKLLYLAFNKPRGVITHNPQLKEQEIKDLVKINTTVFPVGRLDKDSSGLIILSNDGRVTDRLLNPIFDHEKEYAVTINNNATDSFLRKMESGVRLEDGYMTKPSRVKKLGDKKFSITLTEGKKHQIRRMCTALGHQVRELKRVRIMNIQLKNLQAGEWREIQGKELADFLRKIGL